MRCALFRICVNVCWYVRGTVKIPILGIRTPAFRLGIVPIPHSTQLRKRSNTHVCASTFIQGAGGRVLYLMAQGIVGKNSGLWV